MAWARLHDGALANPKIVEIFDPRHPFDLWIWGLSYCQAHLTDGRIPLKALPNKSKKAAASLLTRGLWLPNGGKEYIVHDYLQWNDSKETVAQKRAEAKRRMDAVRANRTSERSQNVLRGVGTEHASTKTPDRACDTRPTPTARTGRVIFSGQKIVVFEWMLDECCKILGNFTEAFDLHAWFFALDAYALAENLIPPKRDNGAWLFGELETEAARRQIPLKKVTGSDTKLTPDQEAAAVLKLVHEQDAITAGIRR